MLAKRGLKVGLVYFVAIAWLFVGVLHIEIILSRIVSASIAGLGG